jgi:hypothetical protein
MALNSIYAKQTAPQEPQIRRPCDYQAVLERLVEEFRKQVEADEKAGEHAEANYHRGVLAGFEHALELYRTEVALRKKYPDA